MKGGSSTVSSAQQEQIKESIKFLRSAVAKIQELSIPANPQNYSIWYEYFAGNKPKLNEMVDKRLQNGGDYNSEFSLRVYNQFFLNDPEKELRSVRMAIRAMIDQLVSELDNTGTGLKKYGEKLEDCEDVLNNDPDISALKMIVDTLVVETRRCREHNERSISQLNQLNNEIHQMRTALKEMSEAAFEDALTGIANRRAFDQKFESLIVEARKENAKLCLILLDIDLFKRVNDEHGHVVGDRVLRFAAETIKRSVKGGDFIARFGGEEFAVLLPNTGRDGGVSVANSILKNVSSAKLKVNKGGKSLGNITFSAGLAELDVQDSLETMLERADSFLYHAKQSGRNKVVAEVA